VALTFSHFLPKLSTLEILEQILHSFKAKQAGTEVGQAQFKLRSAIIHER
jgi:hypothetical protein